jgi:zinc protease
LINTAEDFRRQPPAPLAPRDLKLPKPIEMTLSNGVRLVVVEDRRLPLVNFRLAIGRGTSLDPVELPGLTDMTTGQLTEGTSGVTARTSRQIADEVARLGATLSADANSDYLVVAASALKAFENQILDLMADVVLRPSFPDDELELAKRNTIEGLALQRSQPSFLASERTARAIYGEHPYGVVSPTPEAVAALTRENLIEHHRALFVPAGAVLIAIGDVDAEALRETLEVLFGADAWHASEPREVKFPAAPESGATTLHLVDRKGSQQTNIVIANPCIKRNDRDYFALLLMNTILGANASSRVFMNLREDKGYTYGAYTSLDARREAGSFRASAEVRVDVTGDALREFFYELNRIRDEDVSDEELADAKAYLTGVFPDST